MRRIITYGLMVVAAVFAVAEVSAQKYPERRMARDGNKLYERGDFEGAETRYRHALEANPELQDARFNLAGSLLKQDKADAAAKIYTGFANDSTDVQIPRVADANYNLGNIMLGGQKLDDAIELYKQALRLNPGDMEAKYNLAYAQKLKKEQQDNEDENNDQNQDNQDKNNDQNQDQNQDQNDDQSGEDQDDGDQGDDGQDDQDQNQDQDDGEGDEDEQDGDNQQDQGEPEPDPNGQEQEVSIAPDDAQQMLEAIQDEEDKTREKMNAKEVKAVGASGKNW